MIVKMQTEDGWEWIDHVKRVRTGTMSQVTGERQVVRHLNASVRLEGDHGPYTDLTLVLEEGGTELICTNGAVFLLNENGKTVDRF